MLLSKISIATIMLLYSSEIVSGAEASGPEVNMQDNSKIENILALDGGDAAAKAAAA